VVLGPGEGSITGNVTGGRKLARMILGVARSSPNLSSGMTRGEVLRYAIAFALRRSRKIILGLKEA